MIRNGLIANADITITGAGFDDIFGDLPLGSLLIEIGAGADFQCRRINRWLARHIGLDEAAVTAGTLAEMWPGGGGTDLVAACRRCLAQRSRVVFDDRFHLNDGPRHLAVSLAPLTDDRGVVRQIVALVVDLIERRQAEKGLREVERAYRWLFQNAREGVFRRALDGRYLHVNPALAEILGYDSPAQLLDEIKDPHGEIFVDPARRLAYLESLRDNERVEQFEYQAYRRDGSTIWLSENAHIIRDDDGMVKYCEGMLSDITWRRELEQRLQFVSRHDPVTRLPNRAYFKDHLEVAIAQGQRGGDMIGLLMLDLDHFKTINDGLGHAAGDELLAAVAGRLRESLRAGDIVSRLGGDEFGIIQNALASPNDTVWLAHRVMERLAEPIKVGGGALHATLSVGITIFPDDHRDPDQLLKNAGMALSRAKAAGPNSYEFYAPEMRAQAERRMTLINGLRHALANDEFVVYYQPKIDVASRRIIGLESLLRWRHPEHGCIAPGAFMPLAEETGLIRPIGEWVFGAVCRQIKEWQRTDAMTVPVAVNLSAAQFTDRALVGKIVACLAEAGVGAGSIEIEITESTLINDTEAAIRTLEELVELGVGVSIDDFGTGYSSLSYLRRFPVAKLKIDRSFVNEVADNPEDAAITEAIINLGHSLGIDVIAEGVETEGQVAFLHDHGCDELQGFFYSKPLPPETLVDFARRYAAGGNVTT